MIRILGTIFAALLGLAFGSFLNVCLSRWPEGESVVTPRSHCRRCDHQLAWWENVPLLSWVVLRGRCRGCEAWIGWRYVLVEAAVGALWATVAWDKLNPVPDESSRGVGLAFLSAACWMGFYWVLTALAALDADHLWLPDWLTLPGIAIGFVWTNLEADVNARSPRIGFGPFGTFLMTLLEVVAAAALILVIRWTYWLVRRREGIGIGDAKLMALLAAWLGLPGAVLAFALGVVLGALVSLIVIAAGRGSPGREESQTAFEPFASRQAPPGLMKLPLGTFLCVGGVASALWGQQMIWSYLRWVGF